MKINLPINSANSIVSPASGINKPNYSRVQGSNPPATTATNVVDTASGLPNNPSSLTNQVRELQNQLVQPSNGDFDAAKVEKIRQAISEGHYQVNAGKIADGLLDTVRDLLKTSAEPNQ
ncbi:flagellar biosynthesis anti-sigma factor FlgM [Glaciimonas sp. Gout2]|uniref:flagellar biosynthesis anti-sigma factor FlgM n=2 Tax=Glaciimonas TaxID=1229970 RepID=UPI002AB4C908|nr:MULTISPECIES: flagellar biosynthesis anti-sigma factor FlgM [unclassified Glaciimonas]MDY7548740.1 flagellar biosynthesis anti-sigma factor FlgM [Glaciimonas sp. CA11.2]MEB0013900.1 flagellar biosynthesis anti-sigma factor FlgM [Glaciimonas sp. Cout2]MEB0083835.1 flagellar biosynthesis anti-sigma factor FlgM [Glaciimonas sp. Gout2]